MAHFLFTEELLKRSLKLLSLLGMFLCISLVAGICSFAWWYIQRIFMIGKYYNYRKLPPGPSSSVIYGTPNYPREKEHMWFKDLSKKYGEIFTVWDRSKVQIVLNSPRAIHELCNKRGINYNSRPRMFGFHEVMFQGVFVVSAQYDEAWKKQRKIFNSIVGISAASKFLPYQDYESKQYLVDVINSPDRYYFHAERFGTSLLTTTIYGIRADDLTHPSARGLILMSAWLEANLHGSKYVDDRWPILQRIPNYLAPWRKSLFLSQGILERIAHAWWDPAKIALEKGEAPPCFSTSFLQMYEQEGWTEDEAARITLGLMLAGSGTSAASLNYLIMACALYPETVKKAQEELDRVVGSNRLPNFEDEPNLPYVRAMIKECLRWRPFSNQGFYHASVNDDWYGDYFIPGGSTIIANAYSVHFDEKRWPDPDKFEPMRYIGYELGAPAYANMSDPEKRDHFAYGAGRRICAGMPVAEPTLFILGSRLLWGFNISQKLDKNGKVIPIDTLAYTAGVFMKPIPFPVDIKPRSDAHADVCQNEFRAAKTPVRNMSEASKAGEMEGMARLVKELENHPDCALAMR